MHRLVRPAVMIAVCTLACAAADARAQVVYAARPVVAVPPAVVAAPVYAAPTYVANYLPAGNYAAVTAFSPPMVAEPAAVAVRAAYPPAYTVASPVTVTSYYAPAPVAAVPVPEAVVPVPVTTYYAPAAVAVPMRRGLFGGYRPVRSAYYIAY